MNHRYTSINFTPEGKRVVAGEFDRLVENTDKRLRALSDETTLGSHVSRLIDINASAFLPNFKDGEWRTPRSQRRTGNVALIPFVRGVTPNPLQIGRMHSESPRIVPLKHEEVSLGLSVFGEPVGYQKPTTPWVETPENSMLLMGDGNGAFISATQYDDKYVWATRPVLAVDMSEDARDIPDLSNLDQPDELVRDMTYLFATTRNYLFRTAATLATLETLASHVLVDGVRASSPSSQDLARVVGGSVAMAMAQSEY